MRSFISLCSGLAVASALLAACEIDSGAVELTPLGPSLVEMTATASQATAATAAPPLATPTLTPTAALLPVATMMADMPPISSSPTAAPITPTPCGSAWFAQQATPGWCPDTPAIRLEAAYQTFEHGAMLWREGRGYIILPFNPETGAQNGIVSFYPDEVTIYRDTSGSAAPAPDGLFTPTSGFGLLWRGDVFEQPDSGVWPLLGWATAPETGYTLTEQSGAQPVVIWEARITMRMSLFTLPDGRLLRLSRYGLPDQPTSLQFIAP